MHRTAKETFFQSHLAQMPQSLWQSFECCLWATAQSCWVDGDRGSGPLRPWLMQSENGIRQAESQVQIQKTSEQIQND